MSDLCARETLLLVCRWLITRGREDRCSVCESEFERPVEVFLLNPTLIIQRTLLIFSDGHHILSVIISWGETNKWAPSHWTHNSKRSSDHKVNAWKKTAFCGVAISAPHAFDTHCCQWTDTLHSHHKSRDFSQPQCFSTVQWDKSKGTQVWKCEHDQVWWPIRLAWFDWAASQQVASGKGVPVTSPNHIYPLPH